MFFVKFIFDEFKINKIILMLSYLSKKLFMIIAETNDNILELKIKFLNILIHLMFYDDQENFFSIKEVFS